MSQPEDNLENSENKSSWGGARPNSGRPVGSENAETKLRREAEKLMKDRIVRNTDALLNAQLALARGESSLYRIYYTGTGKDRKKHVDIVTDQETITAFLADELEDTDDEYYYIATKSPDARSIDSLLDRTYGKATVNIANPDGSLAPTVIIEGAYGNKPNFRPDNQVSETDDVAADGSNPSS